MNTEKKQCFINAELIFIEPDGFLKIRNPTLFLTTSDIDNDSAECRLVFQISPALYHHIDTKALFNLKPEMRSSFTDGDFLPELNIQIEINLQPDLLPCLLTYATNADEAAAYLFKLSQQQIEGKTSNSQSQSATIQPTFEHIVDAPQSQVSDTEVDTKTPEHLEPCQNNTIQETVEPLLHTENWFFLSAQQQNGDVKTGFKTLWFYINPVLLKKGTNSGEQLSVGISDFLKEWFTASLSDAVQGATDEFSEEIIGILEELANNTSETGCNAEHRKLFEIVVDFFKANEWPTSQIGEETTVQLGFQGESGQWTCYASTNEDEQNFVFYSLCPVKVPKNRRLAMAEFLTRANYGLTIGNFEMDFDSGDIYYRTSIDVKDDRLSTALIRQLVYANVMIMDQYLSGIMIMIYTDVSAIDAIAEVEA